MPVSVAAPPVHRHTTTTTNAAAVKPVALTKAQVAGTWVASINIAGPYLKAELKLEPSGKLGVRVASLDGKPSPSAPGTWALEKGLLTGTCAGPKGPIAFKLNLAGKQGGDLKKAGGLDGSVNLEGSQQVPFKFVKTDRPFFAQP